MSVQTPNMQLIQPTIAVDSGLVWEQASNANSAILDQHNHTAGSGVQIPPAGLDINAALPFNNNPIISLQAATYQTQTSYAPLYSTYFVGNDLYINDGAGNVIQATSGGNILAGSSGISSGTASASFISSVLTVLSAANTPANIQGGSLLLGNIAVNSKFLTLNPPASMAANYSLTLPASNSSGSLAIMTMDTSNNMAANLNVDNSTITISSNLLKVAPGGITTTQIASATIVSGNIAAGGVAQSNIYTRTTGTSVSAGNVAISAYSSTGNTSTTFPFTAITGTVTLVCTGRPILISIVGQQGSSGAGYFDANGSGGAALYVFVDGALTNGFISELGPAGVGGTQSPILNWMCVLAAGSHTFQLQGSPNSAGSLFWGNVAIMAYEI